MPAAEEEIDKKLKAIQENYERKGFSIVGATIAQGDDIGIKFAISCAFAVQSQTPFDYIICPSLGKKMKVIDITPQADRQRQKIRLAGYCSAVYFSIWKSIAFFSLAFQLCKT